MMYLCQSPSFKVDRRAPWDLSRRTEIPVKDSHTRINMINITHFRIKGLPLTNGHGRYMTVTPERTLVSVGGWELHTWITVINL
jgi:hypothetical protein